MAVCLSPSKPSEAGLRSSSAAGHRIPEITIEPGLLANFQQLIYRETGIRLGSSKEPLLFGRLSRRLRALHISTLAEYYDLVSDPAHNAERAMMIDAITTNETRFFRDARHFNFLTEKLIPRWQAEAEQGGRSRRIRLWSSACASGEEPYSLAMILASHLPANDGWDVQIVASDISTQALARAKEGIYGISRIAEVPEPMLHQYMLKGRGAQEGNVRVTRTVRQMVRFEKINLNQPPYPFEIAFDAIFCCNVLIYFDAESKRKAVDNLVTHLGDDGVFFIGSAENLNGVTSSVRHLAPTIYCPAERHRELARAFMENKSQS